MLPKILTLREMVSITPAKEENKTPDSESRKGEDNFPDYDKQKEMDLNLDFSSNCKKK